MIINKQEGQALLVVVLVMIVALTVGLSLTSRSIINLRTSSEEADSQRALAAAEAGIERSIQTNTSLSSLFSENNTTYSTVVTEAKGPGTFFVNGGNLILQDDGADIWLVPHIDNADGSSTPNYTSPWAGTSIDIYWGTASNDCDNAAIEVSVILYDSNLTPPYKLKRYAYDPCALRNISNNFKDTISLGPYLVEDKNLKYKASITIASGLVARVVPIYASTLLAIKGNGAGLPTQGFTNDATGTSGSGERQVVRRILYFKTYDQLATQYFNYGLFSP